MPEPDEQPPPPSTPSSTTTTTTAPPIYIHPRREPFEHGLLPIPKLIFTDGSQTLISIRNKLLALSSTSSYRANSEAIAESLQISNENARLVSETIASVLHNDSDPIVTVNSSEIRSVGVNVFDLMLFLYIQSYKRLLPKGHKDSAAVADVWPSTSAFDGFISALSPLQLVRSNSRRFMPSQSDEEAHQLSYLQKHLGNILSLLAESVEGDSEESLVLSMEKLEHLGFLVYFGEKGSERIPFSQNAPFFANSDPEMPAVPVPAAQVHDWLLENIVSALTRITERASAKENGPTNASDQDVPMADVSASAVNSSPSPRGPSFIEGISKSSYVRLPNDIKGSSAKVINCHESVIYILAPLKYATVYGCSDATIVLGAVGKAVRVEHCERVHVIAAAKRICIANCRECVFFLGVNQTPLLVGDNHKLQVFHFCAAAKKSTYSRVIQNPYLKHTCMVCCDHSASNVIANLCGIESEIIHSAVAPYNTFYPLLEEHLNEVGIDPIINRWDAPVALGVVDPHDSLSHPAGVLDVQTESASPVDPDQFTNFLHKNFEETKHILKDNELDESRKREVATALHVCFKDWLYGNDGSLYIFFDVHA
ncbi:hypothetical protein RND71_036119 [Anisodus tanguticus]|uniref:TBCC domain-containing protein 1 n=1 Tax=Anisodus tanguticus TaxID=243964 RepID=A0AAE1R6H0_9SOLA|nr:hypothetical protein RND71_036119 [Anisodus tanguticus]